MIGLRVDHAGYSMRTIEIRDQNFRKNVQDVPDGFEADHILELQQVKSEMCSGRHELDDTVVDEITTLANSESNRQLLTSKENSVKKNYVARALKNGYCDREGQEVVLRTSLEKKKKLQDEARQMNATQTTQNVLHGIERTLTKTFKHGKT